MKALEQTPLDEVITHALAELDIRITHSEGCHEETRFWLANTGLDDAALEDLTALPFVTIDNPDSRDLDQALLIERQEEGYRLRYALADASYYIRPGTELFNEALLRGTTFYTPTLAAAMLPIELSEGLISLNPGVNRRALIFDMKVNSQGLVASTSVHRGRIQSQAKLNYAGVQQWLDSGSPAHLSYHESLLLLAEIGQILIDASARRGVVAFDRTETRIQVTDNPPVFEATVRERYDTERYNEQISLLCNMQGAQLLLHFADMSHTVQTVFRTHEAPLKKNINALRHNLEQFAHLQERPEQWLWRDKESLADYLVRLPDDPVNAGRVRAIQRQVMHAQRASTFEPVSGEHHALKATSYARFSSPMREIVGIFTHKELLEALGESGHEAADDEALRERVISAANEARQKQRKLDKKIEFAALTNLFARQLAEGPARPYAGTIMGMRKDRLYVNVSDMAIEIKIYKDCLDEQFSTSYTIDSVVATPENPAQPPWQLGQSVVVQLSGYDKERKHFLFAISDATERNATHPIDG